MHQLGFFTETVFFQNWKRYVFAKELVSQIKRDADPSLPCNKEGGHCPLCFYNHPLVWAGGNTYEKLCTIDFLAVTGLKINPKKH